MSEQSSGHATDNRTDDPLVGDNLWPDNLQKLSVTPPVLILRQQAFQLKQLTSGVLEGEVTADEAGGGTILYSFFIVAPKLDHYRYRLLSVQNGVDSPYPADVFFDATSGYDASDVGKLSWSSIFRNSKLKDEFALKERLREIFTAEGTRKIVESLLAQSQEPAAV